MFNFHVKHGRESGWKLIQYKKHLMIINEDKKGLLCIIDAHNAAVHSEPCKSDEDRQVGHVDFSQMRIKFRNLSRFPIIFRKSQQKRGKNRIHKSKIFFDKM